MRVLMISPPPPCAKTLEKLKAEAGAFDKEKFDSFTDA